MGCVPHPRSISWEGPLTHTPQHPHINSRCSRSQVQTIISSLPEVGSTLLGLGIFVFFCGWMAVLLFQDRENEPLFGSLYTAMWQLLVLLTTTNFPDVMIPAFHANRVACVFFVVFVILGQFFAMNMITASIYKAYVKNNAQNKVCAWCTGTAHTGGKGQGSF